ncbi:MAG: Rieske 2Fe-2S domain-containing protein [Deltaproteobacteria bacterium]|jgi:phenylpropionate dioxygenase-like ring-hydroxylating dioxygenase large terminal subunit|nr:Rieske 2Fe-2S domain-containing protein [Deltaproteobacteria bacterium]
MREETASGDGWRGLDAVIRPDEPAYEGWYVVALAEEVGQERPIGCDFLGGRVAVYRRASGEPVVLTARCPHMGADLSLGQVIDDEIRCNYHHFRFGSGGECTSIPCAGPIPSSSRVHSYPCVEHLGFIWAYNGDEPRFAPPEVRGYSEEDLIYHARRTHIFEIEPWLNIGNTFDFMHLRYVHGFDFDFDPREIRYLDDHHITLDIQFQSPDMGRFEQRILVTGTNAVSYVTATEHETIGLFTSTPIGRAAQSYYFAGVPKDSELAPEDLQKRLDEQIALGDTLLADDVYTLKGIRFKAGAFVGEDQAMARCLRWVDQFPKADPAADFH